MYGYRLHSIIAAESKEEGEEILKQQLLADGEW